MHATPPHVGATPRPGPDAGAPAVAAAAGGEPDAVAARLVARAERRAAPALLRAAARRGPRDADGLVAAHRAATATVHRLLCLACAEARGLLPVARPTAGRPPSLTAIAEGLAAATEASSDPAGDTGLWASCLTLVRAVSGGHAPWGLAPYPSGLFAAGDDAVAPPPPALDDAEAAELLADLLVDRDGAGTPIDFASLPSGALGTVHERLQAAEPDVVDGEAGLRPGAGPRKRGGAYFTKPFVIDHLVVGAIDPVLEDHCRRLAEAVDRGETVDAAAVFDLRVIDPAMGAGAFLVAAVDRVADRLAAFLAERPIRKVAAELDRLRAAAVAAGAPPPDERALLRRLVAARCVHGVDADPLAVELARATLWIHAGVPGLPPPYLRHRLVLGDAVTGVATPQEAAEPAGAAGDQRVRAALGAAAGPLADLEAGLCADAEGLAAAARAHAAVDAAVAPLAALGDLTTAARGRGAVVTDPEVHVDPTDRAAAARLGPAHLPAAFPGAFLRDPPGFDAVVGNPPWEEPIVEEPEFWARFRPGLRRLPAGEQRAAIVRLRRERPDLVARLDAERAAAEQLRRTLHAGPFPGMGTGDADLYKAFCWRFSQLTRPGGAIGAVLPRSALAAKGPGPWRAATLSASDATVATLRNAGGWVFADVNAGYTVCLLIVRSLGTAARPTLRLTGRHTNPTELADGLADGGAALTTAALAERDDALALPDLGSDAEARLLARLLAVPALGAERADLAVRAVRELDATLDRRRGLLDPDAGHSVVNHRAIGHLRCWPEAGAHTACDWPTVTAELDRRRRAGATRRGSAWAAMRATHGQAWLDDPAALPARTPRIAFRDVVHAGNPRKVWAALVPAGTVLTNKAPYLVFPRGELRAQAFVLAMLASSVCDWYAHRFMGLNLNFYLLAGLPLPTFDPDDPRCDRAARLAATLALADAEAEGYGAWPSLALEDPGPPDELVAELDALAALLHGLADEDLALVWGDDAPLRPPRAAVARHRDRWRLPG